MAKRKALTLYDLLGKVADQIEAEPAHYFQDAYVTDTERYENHYRLCGVAYCIGGWLVALTGPHAGDICSAAFRIMGASATQGASDRWLFAVHSLFAAGTVEGTPGTKTYARAGARRVRRFMREHKDRLMAMPAPPVTR